MSSFNSSIGQELLNVPMGDMIREMAFAIADAQIRLDENSIEVAELMGGLQTVEDDNGNVIFEDSRVFFGKERISVAAAVATYNGSSDSEQKAAINTALVGNGLATEETGDQLLAVPGQEATEIVIPARVSMLELGFTPTFYQFVDTIIEVKISISYSAERSSEVDVTTNNKTVVRTLSVDKTKKKRRRRRSRSVTTTQVNAKYASKYSYSAEGSSLLRTKLTPIPPPAILEERIRQLVELAEEGQGG